MRNLRICHECGARHVFTYRPYAGQRVHPGVKETIVLGCRACREPMFEWVDEDGDYFELTLESDWLVRHPPSTEVSRRRRHLASREPEDPDPVESGPAPRLPGKPWRERLHLDSPVLRHPLLWIALVCLVVAVWVAWVALRGRPATT